MSMGAGDDLSGFSMLDLFRMEARQQAQVLTGGLVAAERGADAATLETLMRAAHSIKGAAAIVGLDAAVRLAHAMEDAFVAAQQGGLALTPARIDALLAAVDLIAQLSQLDEDGVAPWLTAHADALERAQRTLANLGAVVQEPAAAPAAAPAATAPAMRAGGAARDFDTLLALVSEARAGAHRMRAPIDALQRFKRHQGALFTALDELHAALVETGDPVLIAKAALVLQKAQPVRQFVPAHLADMEALERRLLATARGLGDELTAMRMCPFREGVQHVPRMVRDLARGLGKQVAVEIAGEDTAVDRAVLAGIEGPLNQLLRNALDHGLETPAERRAAGKPEIGTIVLSARHRGGMLAIEMRDDGRGVDLERIRQVVTARNLASAEMAGAMSAQELLAFLFLPSFSLKETANELSGRGVGLDIVHDAIRRQNGTVRLETQAGRGFCALITLPVTQSLVRALIADVGGEAYAIPIGRIERVLRIAHADIHTLENKQFVVRDGVHLGLVAAAQVLELGRDGAAPAELTAVVIGAGRQSYALVVDAVRGEQTLTVQPLEPVFGKLRNVAAAALLDDGAPCLILDVADLLLSIDLLLREGSLARLGAGVQAGASAARRILVVDDSLTVREMERKLLQGRGYDVDVAVDGVDGWNAVRAGAYDLVVTDVDMPRMDGIELVESIKRDARLRHVPVMIVSYKDRPEDRARGMTAGADYYLAKGSFHDETLLDAVFDLIGEARPDVARPDVARPGEARP